MMKITARILPKPGVTYWIVALLCLAGCTVVGKANEPSATVQERAKHVILMIGDGMQLEHERAYNNYLSGSYDEGLEHWAFPYRGAVTTWDVTTYNRYALASGAQPLVGSDFDPRQSTSFSAVLGYDPAKGGGKPFPLDTNASVGSVAASNYYGTRLQLAGGDEGKFPATDSASAGTALATGFKTDDGNIAWRMGDVQNGRMITIAEMYRAQRQAAIGIVSTVPFSHATPAAFVSHNVSRSNYVEIAQEIIADVLPEVVIGGGHPTFNDPEGFASVKAFKYIGSGAYAQLQNSRDYLLVERAAGAAGGEALTAKAAEATRGGKRLFGLFGGVGGNFAYHAVSDDGSSTIMCGSMENPTLAEAATAALQVLSQNPNGFFLMIEQGDIDWSNHINDFRGMIGGLWDLDQAVRAVTAYIERPGDGIDWSNTLVIVTSDHGNGYMRISPDRKLAKGKLPRQVAVADGPAPAGYASRVSYYYPEGEITYGFDGMGVNSHTNEPVTVYAKGAGYRSFRAFEGRWYPGTTLLDNTQINQAMLEILGLVDENRN